LGCVGREGVLPLGCMLGVAPALAVSSDVLLRALREGQRLCILELALCALRVARRDGIDTSVELLATVLCSRACIRKRERIERAEPHFARPSVKREPKYPALAACRRDL